MRITKTTNPLSAIELMPLYVELPDFDRKALAGNLFVQLSNKPDETLVLVLLDDDNALKGLAVAYERPDSQDTRIWQASAVSGVEKKWVDIMLGMILGWSKAKGYKKVSGETNRSAKLWKRRWGFDIIDENEVVLEIKNE